MITEACWHIRETTTFRIVRNEIENEKSYYYYYYYYYTYLTIHEWVAAAAVSQPHECSTVTQTKYLLTGMEVLQEFVQNLLHMEKGLLQGTPSSKGRMVGGVRSVRAMI
jgi:hypothetical protein